jgi:nicotinamide mononucleotide (NMN) deamidase PncC
MIGEFLTDIPGSSLMYWGGFITYSNEAKVKVLGVPMKNSGKVWGGFLPKQ